MKDCFLGRTALVTGASSGLGEQFARQLAARGCSLVLVARSERKLRALAQELEHAHAVRVVVLAEDLALVSTAESLCCRLEQADIVIDHLVNNAGVGSVGPLVTSAPLAQQQMLILNALSPAALTGQLLPGMIARRAGGVLNVASAAAFYPVPHMANYAASKAFVLSHTQALAAEVRGSGVRVMALCPGPVDTGFQKASGYQIGALERLAALSSQDVVRCALRSYERRKALCIPGLLNKLQAVLPRFVPLTITARIVEAVMRRLGRAGKSAG